MYDGSMLQFGLINLEFPTILEAKVMIFNHDVGLQQEFVCSI
jgi:hypothetical protein